MRSRCARGPAIRQIWTRTSRGPHGRCPACGHPTADPRRARWCGAGGSRRWSLACWFGASGRRGVRAARRRRGPDAVAIYAESAGHGEERRPWPRSCAAPYLPNSVGRTPMRSRCARATAIRQIWTSASRGGRHTRVRHADARQQANAERVGAAPGSVSAQVAGVLVRRQRPPCAQAGRTKRRCYICLMGRHGEEIRPWLRSCAAPYLPNNQERRPMVRRQRPPRRPRCAQAARTLRGYICRIGRHGEESRPWPPSSAAPYLPNNRGARRCDRDARVAKPIRQIWTSASRGAAHTCPACGHRTIRHRICRRITLSPQMH